MIPIFIRSLALLGLMLILIPSGWSAPILQETARIALPGVKGRIDHLTADLEGKRLFVAALGNGSVEVIDAETAKAVQSLKGFGEPQELLFLAGSAQLVVTDAQGDHVTFVDATKLQPGGTVKVPEDSDNVRFEGTNSMVWIGAGSGRSSALLGIEPGGRKIDRQIGLRGHPESFQIEQRGHRIFVNVPTAHVVQVLDRQRGVVTGDWSVPAAANFPMALDENSQRLFVGTRTPARLIVYDIASGKPVATMHMVGDADDIFYDAAARRVYVSGGEGSVQVFRQETADAYTLIETVSTRTGARTSLFVPAWRKLFVAVPRRGQDAAEIRVFSVAP
jgi:DNA-binding beta-propeller fold protein YncE